MTNRQTSTTQPAFRLHGRAGEFLVIRLAITSRMVAPAVIRPRMEPWVLPSGDLVEVQASMAPAYVYIAPSQEARITLSAQVPGGIAAGEILRGGLSFPGAEDDPLPILLEITEGESTDHSIHLTLPLSPYEASENGHLDPAGAKAVSTLLAGLAGMEVIPARWIVAELLLTICEVGVEKARTEEGAEILARLSRLRFYKNGVLAFRGTHLPNWVMIGVTVSSGLHSALGGRDVGGRMLYTWEKWLFDLIDIDIENFADDGPQVLLPPPELDRSLAELGNEAEMWFGYLLLGLMEISPRIRAVLASLAEEAPAAVADQADDDPEISDVLGEEGSIQR
ncbi:MAG: hypothetical protein WBO54_18850 [Thermoanaerobaculia bacterium]